MKRVTYTRVSVEGFQSFGKPVSFKLDRYGLNLIKGNNGVGKSTIFNAILWAEYNGNLKKGIETWEDRRPESWRGTRVVVDRTDGEFDYRVARHLNFKGTTSGLKGGSKLMVFKKPVSDTKFTDKHLLGSGLHKADMQKLIEEQLGIDEKTFLNSILFGQRMLSLIKVKDAEKRKLFEELFDVGFVDIAKQVAQERKDVLVTKITEYENGMRNLQGNIEKINLDIREYERILEDFNTNHQTQLEDAENRLKTIDGRISELTKKIKDDEISLNKYSFGAVNSLGAELQELEKEKRVLLGEISTLDRQVRKFEDEIKNSQLKESKGETDIKNVATVCPTCKQDLPESKIKEVKTNLRKMIKTEQTVRKTLEKDKEKVLKDLVRLQESVKEFDSKIENKQDELNKAQAGVSKAYDLKASIKAGKNTLEQLQRDKKLFESQLEKIKNTNPPKLNIKEKEEEKKQSEKRIIELSSEIEKDGEVIEHIEWWIKKGFGSNGLKSFVFNSMLQELNKYAFNYASRLGFGVKFAVEMDKVSKPFKTMIYEGDFIRDYEDLSGGQQQRVDIVIAFAMHDLISRGTNINILVLDELFEGLDNQGIEVAFDLIRQKSKDKAVYIISHSDIVDSLNAKTIWVDWDDMKNTVING